MSASISVTKVLLFDTGPQTLVADVLAADATATTFLLNCPSGTDSNDCGTYNETVVVGPWAKPTPPPAASTGVYDLEINMGSEWFFHLHCDMSSTVPVDCTTTNLGGNDDGSPTATFTSIATDDSNLGWAYAPITITSGLELLASATAAAESGSAVSSGATSTDSTTALSGTASGTQTQSAASTTGTSAATLGRSEPFAGTVALVCLALGWLLR